ncbi:ABC transporter permease [Rhodobacterales bacterium LSUCC0031]|nr:ABC transporter permease [Rhodobacterales bacterium LSUCC0031]
MFQARRTESTFSLAINMLELSMVAAARKVRQTHRSAIWAILLSLIQAVLFLVAFYFLFTFMGARGAAIRGDFMLYLLSGIFAYLTHIKSVQQIMTTEGATASIMQHAPMNTLVAILSSALTVLYTQLIGLLVLLLAIHVIINPISIHYWPGGLMMFLLSWASGCAIGLLLLSAKPWIPDIVSMVQLVYIRANMIASGKMFVANMMPGMMIDMFDWNPLFHVIDQARGFIFVNYFPHHSNWEYPLYFTLFALLIGFMAEAYTRKHVSASWGAGR